MKRFEIPVISATFLVSGINLSSMRFQTEKESPVSVAAIMKFLRSLLLDVARHFQLFG